MCNLLIFKYWQLIHTVQSKEPAKQNAVCKLIPLPVARKPPLIKAAVHLLLPLTQSGKGNPHALGLVVAEGSPPRKLC